MTQNMQTDTMGRSVIVYSTCRRSKLASTRFRLVVLKTLTAHRNPCVPTGIKTVTQSALPMVHRRSGCTVMDTIGIYYALSGNIRYASLQMKMASKRALVLRGSHLCLQTLA